VTNPDFARGATPLLLNPCFAALSVRMVWRYLTFYRYGLTWPRIHRAGANKAT